MKTDAPEKSSNIARFFTHNRQLAWVALVAAVAWGVFGYLHMPKRKDPDIPVRVGLAIAPWPGIAADKVEQLLTRKIEQAATGNAKVERVESTTQDNVSIVLVRLLDSIANTDQEFQDIGQRLAQIDDLPDGAGPITWISDFGDTAALMLTVASPPVPAVELELRARGVRDAIEQARAGDPSGRVSILYCYPASIAAGADRATFQHLRRAGPPRRGGTGRSPAVGGELLRDRHGYLAAGCGVARLWPAVRRHAAPGPRLPSRRVGARSIIRDSRADSARLAEVAGDRYSYRELDEYTDLIQRTLQRVPRGREGRARRRAPGAGLSRLLAGTAGAYGLQVSKLGDVLGARNITAPGGVARDRRQERPHRSVGRVREHEGDRRCPGGRLVDGRARLPARPGRDHARVPDPAAVPELPDLPATPTARWRRTRAITLAVQMRAGRADRRRSARPSTPRSPTCGRVAARPDRRAHVGSAAAGAGERRPVHASLYEAIVLVVARRADRLLGVALGAAAGAVDPDHAGDDVRDDARARHRHPAGLDRLADHRARPAGGRSRSSPATRSSASSARGQPRLIAAWLGPDQARHGDPVRDDHQHRRLPAVPAAHAATSAASSTPCRSC